MWKLIVLCLVSKHTLLLYNVFQIYFNLNLRYIGIRMRRVWRVYMQRF